MAKADRNMWRCAGGLLAGLWRGRLILPALVIAVGTAPLLLGLLGQPRVDRMIPYYAHLGSVIDVLNSFVPVWLAAIVCGMALLMFARAGAARRWIAIFGAVGLLVGCYPIGLEWVARGRVITPEAQGMPLRVLQFNAFDGNRDVPASIAMIRGSGADVIAIEEPRKLLQVIERIADLYPYRTPCHRDCAAMLMARTAPLHMGIEHRIGTWYPVVNTPGNGPIDFARMDFAGADGKPFTVIGVHLFWPLPPAPAQHQLDTLPQYMAGLDNKNALLLGDFNLTPWGFAMRGLDRDMAPMRRVTRALWSWPVYFWNSPYKWYVPFLPIDQVYVGANWRVVQVRTLPRAGSDHLPVLVELRRPS